MEEFYENIVTTTKNIQSDDQQIKKLKQSRIDNRLTHWKSNLNDAYDNAFNEIILNAKEKIKKCADNGFDRCDLYTYFRNQNVKFNGFYLNDLIKKGINTDFDLIKRIQEELKPFNVYIFSLHKKKYQFNPKYIIRVSWKDI
jgi:hypothetical protein